MEASPLVVAKAVAVGPSGGHTTRASKARTYAAAFATVALCALALNRTTAPPPSSEAQLISGYGDVTIVIHAPSISAAWPANTSNVTDSICPMSVGNVSILGSATCSDAELTIVTTAQTNDNMGCGQSLEGTVGYKEANVSCRGSSNWLNGTGTAGWTIGCALSADIGNVAGDCSLCGVIPDYDPAWPHHDKLHECSGENTEGCSNYTIYDDAGEVTATWPGCDRVLTPEGDGCDASMDMDCAFSTAANCYPCFGVTCDESGEYVGVGLTASRTMPGEVYNDICVGSTSCKVKATNVNASDHLARAILWEMTNEEGVYGSHLVESYSVSDNTFIFDDMNLKVLSMCNYDADDARR